MKTNRIQLAALTALATLARNNPDLPGPSINLYSGGSIDGFVYVGLDGPAALEAWRVALGWLPEIVELKTHKDTVWLAMDAEFMGVPFQVNTFTVPVSVEVASVLPEAAGLASDEVPSGLPQAWSAEVSA
ncbi:hypothetical protein [Streptomyces sp. CA-111067]|uniref:hypothetical protein n=1 Tax=Streptomyces sp. CA-111067 TaxID=3240046 RepID=UPI003D952CEE